MYIFSDLEKFSVGVNGLHRNKYSVSLNKLYTDGRCSCHSGLTSQSCTPGDLPVRSSAGLFRAAIFSLGFEEELSPVDSCSRVQLLLQRDDELRTLAKWRSTTWWVRECCLLMGRSRGRGAEKTMVLPPWVWVGTCRYVPCMWSPSWSLLTHGPRGRPLNNFALWLHLLRVLGAGSSQTPS